MQSLLAELAEERRMLLLLFSVYNGCHVLTSLETALLRLEEQVVFTFSAPVLSLKLAVCSGFSISWELAKSGVFCLCFQFSLFFKAAWTLSTNTLVLERLGNFAVALSSSFLWAHFAFGESFNV